MTRNEFKTVVANNETTLRGMVPAESAEFITDPTIRALPNGRGFRATYLTSAVCPVDAYIIEARYPHRAGHPANRPAKVAIIKLRHGHEIVMG